MTHAEPSSQPLPPAETEGSALVWQRCRLTPRDPRSKVAGMTSTEAPSWPQQRPHWFDLPTGARDWVTTGGRYAYYLPREMSPHDELGARERLAEWDALAGRMLRASLFDDEADPRELRQLAEAVAAVAEQLAVALGEAR